MTGVEAWGGDQRVKRHDHAALTLASQILQYIYSIYLSMHTGIHHNMCNKKARAIRIYAHVCSKKSNGHPARTGMSNIARA